MNTFQMLLLVCGGGAVSYGRVSSGATLACSEYFDPMIMLTDLHNGCTHFYHSHYRILRAVSDFT